MVSFMKKKIDSFLKKISKKLKGPYKAPFLCLVAIMIVSLFGILIFNSNFFSKPLSFWDFSFLTASSKDKIQISSQGLFIEPVKNFLRESPKMTFVQENSLVGTSSPTTITPQILGSILGGIETGTETRREIIGYTVKSGDTLSSIAAEFDISLNTILWANDLSSTTIKKGQELIILPISGVLYSVKRNDTLGGIAKIYKGDVGEIIAFNGLSNEGDIFIGDILIIPNGKMPSRISHIALTPVGESYFIFPCEGKITQGLHPFNAIDIANSCGKPIVAAASGTVQRAGWINNIYGRIVTILHPNGVVTYYGHLSKVLVVPGQRVSAGDIIANIGNSGHTLGATGCHLHFEVRNARNFLADYLVGTYLSWKK